MSTHILQQLLPARVEAEGINSAALQEYLDVLDARRSQVLGHIFTRVAQIYTAPPAAGAGSEGVDGLLVDLASILRSAESQEEAQVAQQAQQHASLAEQLSKAQREAAALRLSVELQQRLADFDAHIAAGSYSEAAWVAVELERACSSQTGPDHAALHDAYVQRSEWLKQVLEHAYQEAAVVDGGGRQLRVAAYIAGTAAPVTELWRALEVLGLLPAYLKRLAEALLEQVLLPIMQQQPPVWPMEGGDEAQGVLSWGEQGSTEGATPEAVVLAALQTIARWVFWGEEARVTELGRFLWPKVASAYIEHYLKRFKQVDEGQADAFQAAAAAANGFEDQAAVAGWVTAGAEGGSRIHAYVRHALNKFLHTKRLRVVSAARNLLTAATAHDSIVVGTPLPVNPEVVQTILNQLAQRHSKERAPPEADGNGAADMEAEAPLNWGREGEEGPLLAIGRYRITPTAQALVELMHASLTEALASGSPAVAQLMCGAVRDVAALLVALPPTIRARELQVPQLAALYHNDCLHIANELLTLPYIYAQQLTQLSASAPINFIPEAQRLRAEADRVLQAQVDRQSQELLGVLAGADRLRKVHLAQRGITARKVVQQLLHALRRLGDVLRDVLPPHDYLHLTSTLLQTLTDHIIDDILAMRDISVEESEDLPGILLPLVEEAPACAAGREAEGAAEEERQLMIEAVKAATPGLLKLQVVLEILLGHLRDIQEWWDSGYLLQCGLTVDEISHLTTALFEDTDLRRDVLQHLTQTLL